MLGISRGMKNGDTRRTSARAKELVRLLEALRCRRCRRRRSRRRAPGARAAARSPASSIAICAARDRVLDEEVHLLDVLAVDEALGLEVADLARDARRQRRGVEARDRPDAGAPGDERRPSSRSVPVPSGVTRPMPVTTTRRRVPFVACKERHVQGAEGGVNEQACRMREDQVQHARCGRGSSLTAGRLLYPCGMRLARLAVLALLVCAACGGKKGPASDQLWRRANEPYTTRRGTSGPEVQEAARPVSFDPKAEEAELKIAEAYFHAKRYQEAIAAFEDFERMHPTSKNLASVEYRRGLAYLAPYRSRDRDRRRSRTPPSFRNVMDRFPGTPWASSAELRIRECREILAGHEDVIADFYLPQEPARRGGPAAEPAGRLPGHGCDGRHAQPVRERLRHATSRRRRTWRWPRSPAITRTARSATTPARELGALGSDRGTGPASAPGITNRRAPHGSQAREHSATRIRPTPIAPACPAGGRCR